MTHDFEKLTGSQFLIALPGDPVYQSEYSDEPSTKQDFLDLVDGDETAAKNLFDCCEWQHPATLIDEYGGAAFFKGADDSLINAGSVTVVHGRWANGTGYGIFLVVYDDDRIPLYKDNNQNPELIAMLIGQEAAAKVLADEGCHPDGSPENYREFTMDVNALHSSIHTNYSIPLRDIKIQSPIECPESSSDVADQDRARADMMDASRQQEEAFIAHTSAISAHAKTLSHFMSSAQLKTTLGLVRGEEREFFKEKLGEIHRLIDSMPKTYDQDGLGDEAVAHLHYFTGAANWYITERDMEDAQHQAFGLADLYGDGGEIGYISIEELKSVGAELDLHWNAMRIGEIKAMKRLSEVTRSTEGTAKAIQEIVQKRPECTYSICQKTGDDYDSLYDVVAQDRAALLNETHVNIIRQSSYQDCVAIIHQHAKQANYELYSIAGFPNDALFHKSDNTVAKAMKRLLEVARNKAGLPVTSNAGNCDPSVGSSLRQKM